MDHKTRSGGVFDGARTETGGSSHAGLESLEDGGTRRISGIDSPRNRPPLTGPVLVAYPTPRTDAYKGA